MKFFPDYVIQYLMQGINTPDNNKANNKGLFNGSKTSILTICMAILSQTIMAIFNKMAITGP